LTTERILKDAGVPQASYRLKPATA
jgi:hypothetical protein